MDCFKIAWHAAFLDKRMLAGDKPSNRPRRVLDFLGIGAVVADPSASPGIGSSRALLLVVFLFTQFFFNGARAEPASVAVASRESRVILDESFQWLTPTQADRTLERLKKAGFNVFIPCVWHGRGVTWPSKLVSYKDPEWERRWKPGRDPLDYLIKKAHSMGIEVHPWFTVVLKQRDFYRKFSPPGMPLKAFNIHDAEFRDLMESLVLEVATRYDVDGINIDYIRSMGICESEGCKEDYNKFSAGRNLKFDSLTYQVNKDARQHILEWNGRSVESFVASLGAKLRKLKPGIVYSVDSVAAYEPLKTQGADSIAWANKGIIDLIFHMEYASPEKLDRERIRKAQSALHEPDKLVIMVGNYEKNPFDRRVTQPRGAKEVVELLEFSRRAGSKTNGVAVYEYPYLSGAQIDMLSEGPFKAPATAHWKQTRGTTLSLQP